MREEEEEFSIAEKKNEFEKGELSYPDRNGLTRLMGENNFSLLSKKCWEE